MWHHACTSHGWQGTTRADREPRVALALALALALTLTLRSLGHRMLLPRRSWDRCLGLGLGLRLGLRLGLSRGGCLWRGRRLSTRSLRRGSLRCGSRLRRGSLAALNSCGAASNITTHACCLCSLCATILHKHRSTIPQDYNYSSQITLCYYKACKQGSLVRLYQLFRTKDQSVGHLKMENRHVEVQIVS